MSDIKTTKILLGIPCYGNQINSGIVSSIFKASKGKIDIRMNDSSFLTLNFNQLLAGAYNGEFTHFVMLHSDIEVLTAEWADKMIEIMQQYDFSVLSVVSPIKDKSGGTSTALDAPDPTKILHRLTMMEVATQLPLTFSPQDTLSVFNNDKLLINTGVMCINLSRIDPTQCYFDIENIIVKKNGKFVAESFSEDWNFSRMLMQYGIKYGATRAISIKHFGNMVWDNQTVSVPKANT